MSEKGLRGEQLGQLYHEAKTYEQRQADEARAYQVKLSQRPRQPHLRISLWGSLLIGAVTLFISSIPWLWESGGVSTIFFTFLVWIVLGWMLLSWAKYTKHVFYVYNWPANPFLVSWSFLGLVMMAVWLNVLSVASTAAWLAVLVLIHFVLSLLASRLFAKIN